MQFTRKFKFDASHTLPREFGEKENQMHGHTYKFEITIDGQVVNGKAVDLNKFKKIVQEEVTDKLDHNHLNDRLEIPSAENISVWIWNQLKEKLQDIYEVKLFETESHWVTYRGEDGN